MANPSTAVRLLFEPVRSLAFGGISGTYAAIGTAFAFPSRQTFIQNLTDATLMFSIDGINDHFPLPSSGFFLNDITSNRTEMGGSFCLAQGTIIYVKTIGTPGTGSVYVSTAYGATTVS